MITADHVAALPLRPARLLQPGYDSAQVDRWRADLLAALSLPDEAERAEELRSTVERSMALAYGSSVFGARYAADDVQHLLDAAVAAVPVPAWQTASPLGPATTVDGAPMLRAVELLHERLPSPAALEQGFDADAVDDWLDRVIRTLRRYEGDPEASIDLLAEDAAGACAGFPARRGAMAYRARAVEQLVGRIANALSAHEAAARSDEHS